MDKAAEKRKISLASFAICVVKWHGREYAGASVCAFYTPLIWSALCPGPMPTKGIEPQ